VGSEEVRKCGSEDVRLGEAPGKYLWGAACMRASAYAVQTSFFFPSFLLLPQLLLLLFLAGPGLSAEQVSSAAG